MNRIELRSLLIKLMLGCLIVAATVAVLAILIGSFSDITGRALGTVLAALFHIAILFGLVSITTSDDDKTKRSSDFVLNVSVVIAVISFFTSVFGIWEVLSGEVIWKLYITYVVVLFAMFHAKTLFDASVVYQKVRPYAYANYALIALVSLMILGLVYLPERLDLLSRFYGRLLAASAIVDVTLSVIVAVMQRLYVQQHPQLQKKQPVQAHGATRLIVALLLFFFVIIPMLRIFFGLFWQ